MRVYLDMCSIQRPLDSRVQLRITVEAEAVLGILSLCESGKLDLVSSKALDYEAMRNPLPVRRQYAQAVLARARFVLGDHDGLWPRTEKLIVQGLKVLDASHLAAAELSQARFLCTCDDRFLRRGRILAVPPLRVVSPLELIAEVDHDS